MDAQILKGSTLFINIFLRKSTLRHIRRHQDHHRHPYQNLCRDLSCAVLI